MTMTDEEMAQMIHGPGRDATMKEQQVFTCPRWCTQPEDEEQWEQHIGEWSEVHLGNGGKVLVRPRMAWFEGSDDFVDVRTEPVEDNEGVFVTRDEQRAINTCMDERWAEIGEENGDRKWAYDGADQDYAAGLPEGHAA